MTSEGEVELALGPGEDGPVAAYRGLVTCGSVWACPTCSAKIAAKRTAELDQLIKWNAERGGSVALLTLTMRHNRGHKLRELRNALTKAWRFVTSSKAWKVARRELGMDGYVRAIEVTHGDNGWHLHIHCLLVFAGSVDVSACQKLEQRVWGVWSRGLARQGMSADPGPGIDVRLGQAALERLGSYLTKLAFETAGGRFKKGHEGGRTPFEILEAAVTTGNMVEIELWWEWEQASRGMRALVWSQGLKGRVGVDEREDEEIAAEQADGDVIAVLPARTWREVYPVQTELLDAAEIGGPEAAYRWLEERGLAFDHREASTA